MNFHEEFGEMRLKIKRLEKEIEELKRDRDRYKDDCDFYLDLLRDRDKMIRKYLIKEMT
jgi:cell shape-determining protein MreC